MLDLAQVGEGTRVLDIAAGSGGQSLEAARRGAVRARHRHLLEHPRRGGRRGTRCGPCRRRDPRDGRRIARRRARLVRRSHLPARSDVSAGQARGARRAREALRAGGRYAAIVFSEPERNRFFSVPISIIRRNAELPPPGPGLPGPFSATNLAELLEEAGFREVQVQRLDAPLRLASAAECTQLERESFGALHQMLAKPRPSRRVRQPGPRSRPRSRSSRARTDSPGRANCWWVQGRSRRFERRPGRSIA